MTTQHYLENKFQELKPTVYNDRTLRALAQLFTLTDMFEFIPYSKLPKSVQHCQDNKRVWQLAVRSTDKNDRDLYDVMSLHYFDDTINMRVAYQLKKFLRARRYYCHYRVDVLFLLEEKYAVCRRAEDHRIPNTIASLIKEGSLNSLLVSHIKSTCPLLTQRLQTTGVI